MKQQILLFASIIAFSFGATATTHMISVKDFAFDPASTSVPLGDTVMFIWAGGSHTTTSTTVPVGAATWDSPLTSAQQSFVYVPTVVGNYNYTCTPHSAMGMQGSFQVTYPTAIPGIAENAPEMFRFWPNPARSFMHIQFAATQPSVKVYVTDITGTTILQHSYVNMSETEIDIANLPQGRYVLYATNGSEIYGKHLIID